MQKALTTQLLKGVLTVSILVGSASAAHAAGKYAKKEAEVLATQTELTTPRKKVADHEPNLRAKAFLFEKSTAVKAATDGQIILLKKLEAMTSENDSEKPDLLFRLGQLYEENSRYYNFRARELDEVIFQERANLTST